MKNFLPIPGTLALLCAVATLPGCASKPDTEFATQEPAPVAAPVESFADRSYHSSWGHSGRGGAALRKSTYQHVLATPDRLDTSIGQLYPATGVEAAFPAPAVADEPRPAIAFPAPDQGHCTTTTTTTISGGARVLAREQVSDYLQVQNKLCAGVERLSYEEWQVLINSTPRDVPLHLKPVPQSITSPEGRIQ